jgi:hypothetical protein
MTSEIPDRYRPLGPYGTKGELARTNDLARQHQAAVKLSEQVLAGRGNRANDLYAGRDGDLYRRGVSDWEKHECGGWRNEDLGDPRPEFNREQHSRLRGSSFACARGFGGGMPTRRR